MILSDPYSSVLSLIVSEVMNSIKKTYSGLELTRRDFLQRMTGVMGGVALQRALPPVLFRRGPAAQGQTAINVMDPAFGAKGDGTTNDRAAFQAAMDAAIEGGLPLVVPQPPQFYRIALDPNNERLLVHGDLAVVGEGRHTTTLRFTVQTTATGKNYAAFYVAGGVNFQLADLRLEEDLHQSVDQFEFAGVYFESSSRQSACLVEGVDVEGFTHCLYSPSSGTDAADGELFLAVRDCDLHPWWTFCIALWTVPGGHKRLHIYDSYLHDNQNGHLVYCHPHNSVHVENTRFDGASSWAFHFQGTEVAGDPEYQRFIGCWFGPRNSQGLITQDRATVVSQVEVRNCTFEGQPSIQIRSDILIDGCYFTNAQDSARDELFIGAYSNAPWRATIRNCIFAPKSNVLPQVDLRLADIDVTIENCQFYNQRSGAMLTLGSGAANRYTVSNCLFYNRPDNASQSIAIEIDSGQTLVDNCRFFGRAIGDRGVIVLRSSDTGPTADSLFQIDNCTFQNISGGTVFYAIMPTANTWSGKIAGVNNRIVNLQTGKPLLIVDPPAPVYGRLTPVAATAPSSLPAGPTIVISSNYDSYELLGAADIAAIHWWTDDGLSDPLFSGAITLKATVTFALVSGGNIQLASGAARREVPANDSVRLTYDSTQGFWSEG